MNKEQKQENIKYGVNGNTVSHADYPYTETTHWKDRKHFMWFPFSFTKYELKNDRLYTEHGFFTTHHDELLLYRVTDICLTRTLSQKLFGTGTIILYTRIDADKQIFLENIKHSKKVKDILSANIETARTSRDLVRKDFFGGNTEEEEDGYHDMM